MIKTLINSKLLFIYSLGGHVRVCRRSQSDRWSVRSVRAWNCATIAASQRSSALVGFAYHSPLHTASSLPITYPKGKQVILLGLIAPNIAVSILNPRLWSNSTVAQYNQFWVNSTNPGWCNWDLAIFKESISNQISDFCRKSDNIWLLRRVGRGHSEQHLRFALL